MAEEIINIATLTIDKTEANKSIVDTKAAIFELQKANSELRKDITKNGDVTGEQTKKFVENEQALKKLNAQYKAQSAAINDLTLSELKENKALTDTAKSRGQAIAQTKELKEIRDQLNTETAEGVQALAMLNDKINKNNEFLKNNGSEQEKAATITGNYRQKIFDLSKGLDEVIPGFAQARTVVSGFSSVVGESSDKVTGYANSAIQGARAQLGFKTSTQLATESTVAQTAATETQTVAQEAQTVATAGTTTGMKLLKIAIISTGIGALVILLVAAVTALQQNEASSNKFAKALSGLKGIVNALLSVLRPLGEFLIDTVVASFDLAGRAAEKALGLISKGLALIGLDKAAKSVDNFTASVKGSIQASQQLTEAENRYAQAQRYSTKIQLDYQKQAEKIRQLRDDESRSIPQRIKDNEKLGEVLKKQSAEELKIANQAIAIANLRIKLTGKSKDNLNELAEAQTKASDIQERISGQESEQLANLNSLRKESADKAKELATQDKERKLKALNGSVLAFDQEKKSAEEQLAFYEDYYAKLNKLQGGAEQIANANALSQKLLSIASETIASELELQKKATEDKKKLSETERDELLANSEFLKNTETARVENSKLSERDKAIALEEIQKGYLENVKALNASFDAAEKERKAVAAQEAQTLSDVAFELRVLEIQDRNATESEMRQAHLDLEHEQTLAHLESEKNAGKKTAEEVRALKELEDKKYAKATADIDKERLKTVRGAYTETAKIALQFASEQFGNNKALAVASALINTYQGISAGVALGYPAAIPAVAAAAFAGFAAVKNILKTDKGSTGGGSSASASTTSTPAAIFENPARTQTVASVNAPPIPDPVTGVQPVLVLETLNEAQKNQLIKINSK
jgi:hypothetical protein